MWRIEAWKLYMYFYIRIYVFPFCISPCKQSQFDLISSFHPLNLSLTFSIDHAKRQLGGRSCLLPLHSLLSGEDERSFLGWAMRTPHGTAKSQLGGFIPTHIPPPPPPMNLLLTSELISSVDTTSYIRLHVVICFSSTKLTSGRCCICIPGTRITISPGYLWHPLPPGRGQTDLPSAARLQETSGMW